MEKNHITENKSTQTESMTTKTESMTTKTESMTNQTESMTNQTESMTNQTENMTNEKLIQRILDMKKEIKKRESTFDVMKMLEKAKLSHQDEEPRKVPIYNGPN